MEVVKDITDLFHAVKDKESATHYNFRTQTSFRIDDDSHTEFWKNYCEWVKQKLKGALVNSDSSLLLGEIITPNKPYPLILNLSFHFEDESVGKNVDKLYKDGFVTDIIYQIQRIIKDVYIIDIDKRQLVCCFSRPDKLLKEGTKKSLQFRLQFPNFKMYLKDVDTFISVLVKILEKRKILSKLNAIPINNNWADIITTPLTKAEALPLYLCDHPVFPLKLRFIVPDDSSTPSESVNDYFTIESHQDVVSGKIIPDISTDLGVIWFPLFFSINYCLKITHKRKNVDINNLRGKFTLKKNDDNPELIKAKNFLELISPKRLDKKHFCIDIGKAIYNIFVEYPIHKSLKLWKRLVVRGKGLKEEVCDELYETFSSENPLSIRTLGWYAREDSPVEFKRWAEEEIRKSIRASVDSGRDWEIGMIFKNMFWLDYLCASVRGKVWYHYNSHRWEKIDDGSVIRNILSTSFTEKIRLYYQQLYAGRNNPGNGRDDRINADKELKTLTNIVRNMGDVRKKDLLVRQLCDQMLDKDFLNVIDKNPAIMGVKNGVIECLDEKAIFRKGKPDDFITMQSECMFPVNYNWDHPRVKELLTWYSQLYPDSEERNYVMKVDSSFLEGENKDKKMYVMAGAANGGKSIRKTYFEKILGSYSFTLPESEISSKKSSNSSGLKPGLALASKSNQAWIVENTEEISGTDMKMYTGNDKLFMRLLFDSGGNSVPRFKLVYMCNFVPMVKGADSAIFERMLVIPHDSLWSHDAPSDIKEQYRLRIFKRDDNFKKRLHLLAPAGLWILLKMFKKYRREGLNVPRTIREATTKYWNENDIYGSYITEKLEKADDSIVTKFDDIYHSFTAWKKTDFTDHESLSKPRVKKIFQERLGLLSWGKLERTGWRGVRFTDEGTK